MTTEVLRRTGRGGAGNYYWGKKKKLAAAAAAASTSASTSAPESEKNEPTTPGSSMLNPKPDNTPGATLDPDPPLIRIQTQTFSGKTRTGRGGAGNFGPAWAAAAAADCGISTANDPDRASRKPQASGADNLAAKAKIAVAAINLAAKSRSTSSSASTSGRGGAGNWTTNSTISSPISPVVSSRSYANSIVSRRSGKTGSSGESLMSRSTMSNGDRVIRWMKSAEWRHWRKGPDPDPEPPRLPDIPGGWI